MPRKNQPGCPCGCSTGPCTQTFCVTSCLGSVADFDDITVTVYSSEGGSSLASGTIDDAGCVTLSWTGGNSQYYVVVSAGDLQCYAETLTLACGDNTRILPVNSLCLCFGDEGPPNTLDATWIYSYLSSGITFGPFTIPFTFIEAGPNSGVYFGNSFTLPIFFSWTLDFTQCLLGLENGGCGNFPFVPPSTCNPLNLVWNLGPIDCTLFGQAPPTITGTLTVTG